jgi:ribosome-binding factor A
MRSGRILMPRCWITRSSCYNAVGLNEVNVSRRTERVGHLIRLILAQTIQNRLSDPRIPTITSVTRVEVSDDFSVARVFVSVMAPEAQRKLCLTALRKASGLFRRVLAPELSMRKIPALEFRLDDSLRRGFETVAVIDRAMRELGQVPEWERDEDEETAAGEEGDAPACGGPEARQPTPDREMGDEGNRQEGA